MLERRKALRKESAETRADISDLKSRTSSQGEIRGQFLILLGALGRRFGRTEERLTRIERRLDLVEA